MVEATVRSHSNPDLFTTATLFEVWLLSSTNDSGRMRPNGLFNHLIEVKGNSRGKDARPKPNQKENDNENARITQSSLRNRQGQLGTGRDWKKETVSASNNASNALPIRADSASAEDVRAAVDQVAKELGELERRLQQAASQFLRQFLVSRRSQELPCRQMIDRVFRSCPSSWFSAT
jgi:hypothetical protein